MSPFQPLDDLLDPDFFRVAFEFAFVSIAILVLWENMLAEDQL